MKRKNGGCLFLFLYFILCPSIALYMLIVSKHLFLYTVKNRIERKKMIVTEYTHVLPNGDYAEKEFINGIIDKAQEMLDVEEVINVNDTIDVWYYKNGPQQLPFIGNCRVWHYKPKHVIINKFKKYSTIIICLIAVFMIGFGINYYKLRNVKD